MSTLSQPVNFLIDVNRNLRLTPHGPFSNIALTISMSGVELALGLNALATRMPMPGTSILRRVTYCMNTVITAGTATLAWRVNGSTVGTLGLNSGSAVRGITSELSHALAANSDFSIQISTDGSLAGPSAITCMAYFELTS